MHWIPTRFQQSTVNKIFQISNRTLLNSSFLKINQLEKERNSQTESLKKHVQMYEEIKVKNDFKLFLKYSKKILFQEVR
jgi:hypothetical protein